MQSHAQYQVLYGNNAHFRLAIKQVSQKYPEKIVRQLVAPYKVYALAQIWQFVLSCQKRKYVCNNLKAKLITFSCG
jgi:hypothetical protein